MQYKYSIYTQKCFPLGMPYDVETFPCKYKLPKSHKRLGIKKSV
jgi:hypothetical protein